MTRLTQQSPWDCSRQYRRYSHSERSYIISSYKRGKDIGSIAKRLKRGGWAITVEIARHFNNWAKGESRQRFSRVSSKSSNRAQTGLHQTKFSGAIQRKVSLSEYTKFAKAQKKTILIDSNLHVIRRSARRKRKFPEKKQTGRQSAKEVSEHLKTLLRGSFDGHR